MAGQDALDHGSGDRPLADAEGLFESHGQMLLDLQWRLQPAGKQPPKLHGSAKGLENLSVAPFGYSQS